MNSSDLKEFQAYATFVISHFTDDIDLPISVDRQVQFRSNGEYMRFYEMLFVLRGVLANLESNLFVDASKSDQRTIFKSVGMGGGGGGGLMSGSSSSSAVAAVAAPVAQSSGERQRSKSTGKTPSKSAGAAVAVATNNDSSTSLTSDSASSSSSSSSSSGMDMNGAGVGQLRNNRSSCCEVSLMIEKITFIKSKIVELTACLESRLNVNKANRAKHIESLSKLDSSSSSSNSNSNINSNSSSSNGNNIFVPRIYNLCQRLKLDSKESNLLHLLCASMSSRDELIFYALALDEDTYVKKYLTMQRLVGMSETDMDYFLDTERAHMKESLVSADEEQGLHYNVRISKTAAHILYGRPTRPDELLKISQTTLEVILSEEKVHHHGSSNSSSRDNISFGGIKESPLVGKISKLHSPNRGKKRSRRSPMEGEAGGLAANKAIRTSGKKSIASSSNDNDYDEEEDLDDFDDVDGDNTYDDGDYADGDDDDDEDDEGEGEGAEGSEFDNMEDSVEGSGDTLDSLVADAFEADEPTLLTPYPTDNQLEYLEDGFQLVALYVRINSARMKDDMKKEGTALPLYRDSGEVKQSKRELQAKIKVLENRLAMRVVKSRQLTESKTIPRLETLTERLFLDAFEKKIILLLVGKTVSPVVKALMDALDNSAVRIPEDSLTVGQCLTILCQDFRTQISSRPYFYKSSRLLRQGIITLNKARWHQSCDLTDQRVSLDRRVLDYIVGLDSEINELVEGSDLYEPKVHLDDVVLPKEQLDMLVTLAAGYKEFIRSKERYSNIGIPSSSSSSTNMSVGLASDSPSSTDSSALKRTSSFTSPSNLPPQSMDRGFKLGKLSYGNCLLILLYGKPGTGKTMTVNAIAHSLQKKVLMVDFGALLSSSSSGGGGGGGDEVDLRGLFREASMNNDAIIFFDECEYIFRNRQSTGPDRMLNTLLTEMERHEGLVFLATNRPYDLDEAMHRRITAIVELKPPDHERRYLIWKNLLGESYSSDDSDSSSSSSISSNSSNSNSSSNNKMVVSREKMGGVLGYSNFLLSNDVDMQFLAFKYELTGGFIKNAVLSALLYAIHRKNSIAPSSPSATDKNSRGASGDAGVNSGVDLTSELVATVKKSKSNTVILHQADLINGCKLQMRGNLIQRPFETKVVTTNGFTNIILSPSLLTQLKGIVSYEESRICTGFSYFRNSGDKDDMKGPSSAASLANAFRVQKACIVTLMGTSGSGKKTVACALACELGRVLKVIHFSDLMAGDDPHMEKLKSAIADARLCDAVIAIDGFEHVLEDAVERHSSDQTWKLNVQLSRIIDSLFEFNGLVLLLCRIDAAQNVALHKDLVCKLFSIVKMTCPPKETRQKIWSHFIPSTVKLDEDVNFLELSKKYDLQPGSIAMAIQRAISYAFTRGSSSATSTTSTSTSASGGGSNTSNEKKSSSGIPKALQITVRQKDFIQAADCEVEKFKSTSLNYDILSKLFS